MPFNASAGPSRPRKPFVSADHRPEKPDGKFRVLLISSGSVASIKIPDIVGVLSKNDKIRIQVVATQASRYFYSQESVDGAIREAKGKGKEKALDMDVDGTPGDATASEVRVWTDEDEWSDWKSVGDPILHIELRRWADLVVVAPCSADFLAKLAAGFCDNLPLSVMRALPPSTPVVLCPAMNTMMYEHPFTADHLEILQTRLGYLVLGPQGVGKLACGDAGAGKMTDWRDIVGMIESLSEAFLNRKWAASTTAPAPAPAPAPVSVAATLSNPVALTGPEDRYSGFRSYLGELDHRWSDLQQDTRPPPVGGGATAPPPRPAQSEGAATQATDPYSGWTPGVMASIDHRWKDKNVPYKSVEPSQFDSTDPIPRPASDPPSASAAEDGGASFARQMDGLNAREGGWASHMSSLAPPRGAGEGVGVGIGAAAPGHIHPELGQAGRGDYYDFRISSNKDLYVPGLPTQEGVIGQEGPSWRNDGIMKLPSRQDSFKYLTAPNGGEGQLWARKFWMG